MWKCCRTDITAFCCEHRSASSCPSSFLPFLLLPLTTPTSIQSCFLTSPLHLLNPCVVVTLSVWQLPHFPLRLVDDAHRVTHLQSTALHNSNNSFFGWIIILVLLSHSPPFPLPVPKERWEQRGAKSIDVLFQAECEALQLPVTISETDTGVMEGEKYTCTHTHIGVWVYSFSCVFIHTQRQQKHTLPSAHTWNNTLTYPRTCETHKHLPESMVRN